MEKVLVIDGDADVRESIAMALNRDGYKATAAANGGKAVEIQRQTPADIVITAIFMPEEDGLETIMELRRDFPDVKIIAIPGRGTKMFGDILPYAKKSGADIALMEPFSFSQLRQAVHDVLASEVNRPAPHKAA